MSGGAGKPTPKGTTHTAASGGGAKGTRKESNREGIARNTPKISRKKSRKNLNQSTKVDASKYENRLEKIGKKLESVSICLQK